VIILGFGVFTAGPAHADFTVTPATITMTEGGTASILLMDTDNERFSIGCPRGYGSQTHFENRSIVFTSDSGATAITVQFSTNYAGVLPKQEALRDQVAANRPTASLVISSTAGTGLGPAQSFDLFQPAGNSLMLRIRDAYVAYPEGSVEFTFSCASADFDKKKVEFMLLLNSFRLLNKDTKINP
jgi:hypothetical protein